MRYILNTPLPASNEQEAQEIVGKFRASFKKLSTGYHATSNNISYVWDIADYCDLNGDIYDADLKIVTPYGK